MPTNSTKPAIKAKRIRFRAQAETAMVGNINCSVLVDGIPLSHSPSELSKVASLFHLLLDLPTTYLPTPSSTQQQYELYHKKIKIADDNNDGDHDYASFHHIYCFSILIINYIQIAYLKIDY